jgi:hypothetical protein
MRERESSDNIVSRQQEKNLDSGNEVEKRKKGKTQRTSST